MEFHHRFANIQSGNRAGAGKYQQSRRAAHGVHPTGLLGTKPLRPVRKAWVSVHRRRIPGPVLPAFRKCTFVRDRNHDVPGLVAKSARYCTSFARGQPTSGNFFSEPGKALGKFTQGNAPYGDSSGAAPLPITRPMDRRSRSKSIFENRCYISKSRRVFYFP